MRVNFTFLSHQSIAPQNLPECKSLTDIRTGFMYSSFISASIGVGLATVGYLVHRHSKKKSKENRASLGAKVLLILLAIVGFFMILAAVMFGSIFFPI